MTFWCVRERKSKINLPELRASAAGFAAAFRSPRLWAVAGFLAVINLNPGMVTPRYSHLKEHVGLDESFLAVTDAYTSIGYAGAVEAKGGEVVIRVLPESARVLRRASSPATRGRARRFDRPF
jgi:hypothetical protein